MSGPNQTRYPDPQTLRRALRLGWQADTSADPDGWTDFRPSHGQCAVTALAVQDAFGGQLLRAVNEGVNHYWNRLPDGTQHDLTRDQFDQWAPSRTQVRAREYVLSFPVTAERYRRLLDRIGVVP